ncbi:glycosyltransferase [Chloroflexota bacterium]
MNVLFIHEVDWLSKVVFDIHSLAESLSLLGHKVYAIDYENTWKRRKFLDFGSLRTTELRSVSRAFPEGSVCLRRPGFIRIPGISRLSAGLTHWVEIGKTIREKGIEAVVLYSVPTNGLQTIRLAKRFNIPVVFRAIDILDQLVPNRVLRPPTKFLEKRVYRGVDSILTLTPKLSSYVIDLGAREANVTVLPMPVDSGLFNPSVETEVVRRKWGFEDGDRIVLFIGTLFGFSGLDVFLRRFPRVLDQVPEARLLIVGDGPQRKKLEGIIDEIGLGQHVTITGFQPYETMPHYINLADVCINTFLMTGATRNIFPGKLVQYLACGRAVVATALPGTTAVIPGEKQGIVYGSGPDELAAKVVAVLESNEYRQQLEEAAINYVGRVHGHEKIARQLEAALAEAINRKGDF